MRRYFQQTGLPAIAWVLVGLVLLLNAMGASPALHELMHPDAADFGHQCAVTLFSHGHVDSASVAAPVAERLIFPIIEPAVKISLFGPAIENLPAGRAPPVSAS